MHPPVRQQHGQVYKADPLMELSKYLGIEPEDWWKFVRMKQTSRLPSVKNSSRGSSRNTLEIDWKRKKIISSPKIKFDVSAQPTNLKRLCRGLKMVETTDTNLTTYG